MATALGLFAISAPGASAASGYYLVNVNSARCLAIGSASTAQGAHAIQWTCESGHAEQQWAFTTVASYTYTITNVNSGQCLAIGNASSTNGAAAIQWPCETGHAEQQWVLYNDGHLQNVSSGLCLAIGSANTANGAGAIQWNCEGWADGTHPEQEWALAT
ncbi:RICIN domain-containing protein [Streptomyces sp. NPDC047061]|uniref:RICIN domain-containing protein n=1 Tax=Streptomyces sp. NPDC047061 TaxID=3154605 RepID=UPI0033FB1B29